MKRQKPIRKVSKKRARQYQKYKVVRLQYLTDNPNCEKCGGEAHEIHHKKGREEDLLCNPEFFMAVCRPCHDYIEDHPSESYKKGWMISRGSLINSFQK